MIFIMFQQWKPLFVQKNRNYTKFKQDPNGKSLHHFPTKSIIFHSFQNIRPCAKVAFNAPVSIGSPKAVPVPWHSTRCSCGPVSSANERAWPKITKDSLRRPLQSVSLFLVGSSQIMGLGPMGKLYILLMKKEKTWHNWPIRGNSS